MKALVVFYFFIYIPFSLTVTNFVPRLVLRIATDDSRAVCRLSVKFGAPLKACRGLLEQAKALGLDVIGVSFHVGSGCTDPDTYSQAIADARCVFDMGVSCARNAYATDICRSSPNKVTFNSQICDLG